LSSHLPHAAASHALAAALVEVERNLERLRTSDDDIEVLLELDLNDADGFYHYCGRGDDMMKVAGMWVSPSEVENALLSHPAVAEAAVVAHADSVGITRTIGFVVLSPGIIQPAGGLDSEIHAWVHTRLVGYKCPHEIRFVTELPKTATGKIQRFVLRQPGAKL